MQIRWDPRNPERQCSFFTVRKRNFGKVMFSEPCVKNSVRGRGGGGVSQHALGQVHPQQVHPLTGTPPSGSTHPRRKHTHPRRLLHRTVHSYWNAFFSPKCFQSSQRQKYLSLKGLEPSTSCVGDQDSTTTTRKTGSLKCTQIHASVIDQISWIRGNYWI